MHEGKHRVFLVRCDQRMRNVSAEDCGKCERGTVLDNKLSVLCDGQTKYFLTPCCSDMKSAASVADCEKCEWGELGEDRLRVYCSKD